MTAHRTVPGSALPRAPSGRGRLADKVSALLLGTAPRGRLILKRIASASVFYGCCMLAQWQAVALGFVAPAAAAWMSFFFGVGAVGFYVAVRSGWSHRFQDPSMTLAQMVYPILLLALGYQIDWHVRGLLPMMTAMALVFGAFTLAPAACRRLGWLAVAAYGVSMLVGAVREPLRFPPLIELIHFVFVALVLPAVAHLAGQLSQMRSVQRQQKEELRVALARLEELATQDELTGLPNRRHMQSWIAHEFARSQRSRMVLCVAMIDLDHFKRVNDVHGHAVGDQGLQIFAREARGMLRAGDMLARWGGEEFLLAMPDTTIEDAARVLDRLRTRLAEPRTWADCAAAQVSFSAGLTTHQPAHALADTVRRADDALYQAKRDGRNRQVVV